MQRLYSMTKKTTQLSGVWLSCLNIYFFIMLSLGWGHQVAPISKQTGLYPGNICPLQAFMGILNLVCFEWQALLTLLTSLFWWNLHDFFKLNMKPTTLTVGANTYEHCNQNLLDFSFLLLVGKIWFSVFADDAALFRVTFTYSTLLLVFITVIVTPYPTTACMIKLGILMYVSHITCILSVWGESIILAWVRD